MDEITKQARLIANRQAAITHDGKIKLTPNMVVFDNGKVNVRFGRPIMYSNGETPIGFKIEIKI